MATVMGLPERGAGAADTGRRQDGRKPRAAWARGYRPPVAGQAPPARGTAVTLSGVSRRRNCCGATDFAHSSIRIRRAGPNV